MIPAIVYVLCAATSIACAALLWRVYRASGTRLLFWSALAFIGFAANNALLFVDLVIFPSTFDLSLPRAMLSMSSVGVLLYGLVWEGAQ